MKLITRTFIQILMLSFCIAANSQPVEHPHNEALAAVRAGNLTKLKTLIEQHGANMNARNRPGESLLLMAIKAKNKEIANYLLEIGANVNVANTSKVTPLMAAAFTDDAQMAKKLIEKNADIHAVDQLKKTAIVYAAGVGATEIVEMLLAKGVDINARYANDLTVLMWAAGSGHNKTVEALLARGADPELLDNRGKNALQIADDGGQLDAKKILMEKTKGGK
jgi:ankyrin repeat protein